MLNFEQSLKNMNDKEPYLILRGGMATTNTTGTWSYLTLWCANYPDLNTHLRGAFGGKSFEIPAGFKLEPISISFKTNSSVAIPNALSLGVGYDTGLGTNVENNASDPATLLSTGDFRLSSGSITGLDPVTSAGMVADKSIVESNDLIVPVSGFPPNDFVSSKMLIPDNIAGTKVNVVAIINVGGIGASMDNRKDFLVLAKLVRV